MTINEAGRPDTRPLLPGDEDQIRSQFAKRHVVLQNAELQKRNLGHVAAPVRSTSSQMISEPFEDDSLQIHRALTNTDTFIPMQNNDQEFTRNRIAARGYNTNYDKLGSSTDDQTSLGSEDNLTQPAATEHGMQLDPSLRKQREEWADKGAAKVVRDITNPNTGQTTKEVIKKGIKDFKFGDTLGDGSYSTVMIATARESGKKYAAKVLSKEYLIKQKKVKYVNIEKNALQRLNNSKSTIRLYFTFQDEASLYFLLEYAPNGDFLSIMKKYGSLSEDCTCYYSAQVIDAIKFLHNRGIIHRDIKPENILLDREMKVKLTDFGTAKLLDNKQQGSGENYDLHTRSKSFVGTAEYVSPELLNDNWVDYRCDIWAFGCIVFQMIAGKPPFKATNEYLTFQKVMKVQYAFTAGFPVVIRDLIKRILIKQPDQRLTIPQIERHYFFKDKSFKDGSIWEEPAPEIQPYRVTAKSMQPIPALNTNQHQYQYHPKRPLYSRPANNSKLTVSEKGSTNTANISANTARGSGSGVTAGGGGAAAAAATTNTNNLGGSSSTAVGQPKSSPVVSQKKAMDDTTAQILDRARREVDNRKTNSQKRTPLGPAALASAIKKNQSPVTNSPSSSATSPSSYIRPKSAATVRSTNSQAAPMIFPSNNGSTTTVDSIKGASMSPPVSQGSMGQPPVSRVVSNETATGGTVGKMDQLWEYYLMDLNEHVLGAGEVNFAVVDNNAFERRVYKSHGSLSESQRLGSSRATLLSQVARGGGGVTGLRNDSNSTALTESDYYETVGVEMEDIHPDYQVLGGDPSLNPTDHKESSSASPAEDNPNAPIQNKFKRFFYHKPDVVTDVPDLGNYYRRMLVVTTYGRVLVLVKRKTLIPGTSMNFDLCNDINLSQLGVRVKEVSVPSVTGKSGNFVIQTPYDSFLFRTTIQNADGWMITLHDCIKNNHERLVTQSKKEAAKNEDAMKAAKLATPALVKERSGQQRETHPKENRLAQTSQDLGSPPMVSSKTPKTPRSSLYSIASEDSSTTSLPGTSSSNRNTKNERMFDSFVSSKEKNSKKQTGPVPISSKLVHGLPLHNYNNSIGLGISSQNNANPAVVGTPKTPKKIINPSNSRLLARSEQTFRRKP